MEVSNYITELKIGSDQSLEKVFNFALKQIFSQNYLNKIEKTIKKRISLNFIDIKKQGVEGYSTNKKIFINKNEYDKKILIKKVELVLHEFIHILQRSKSFFILKSFKELENLTNKLNKIVKKNLVKPYTFNSLLAGHEVKVGGKYEIIAYLLADRIKWKALSQKGKIEFYNALKESNIFNLKSMMWKKILVRMKY